jgi:hypothetical protein
MLIEFSTVSRNWANEGGALYWACTGINDPRCNRTHIIQGAVVNNRAIGGGVIFEGGVGTICPFWQNLCGRTAHSIAAELSPLWLKLMNSCDDDVRFDEYDC